MDTVAASSLVAVGGFLSTQGEVKQTGAVADSGTIIVTEYSDDGKVLLPGVRCNEDPAKFESFKLLQSSVLHCLDRTMKQTLKGNKRAKDLLQ